RQLGGALAKARPEHGALASIDAAFAMFAVGIAATPEQNAAVDRSVSAVKDALAPWEARSMYLNFAERPRDERTFVSEQAYRRLRRVKAAYDPGDVIRSNHPVPPAG